MKHLLIALLAPSIVAIALIAAGCGGPSSGGRKKIEPVYDQKTGKLMMLKYDSDGDGKFDTWSYMDGARVVRIDIDKDEDGRIDRWEHYNPDQRIDKVGLSRNNDGKEDAWSYSGPDGSVSRIEVSTRRDGEVSRIEHYEHDRIVSAEEDSDGDGKTDKWETYAGDHLVSVAFDTVHRGKPDRRLIYGPNGTARLEVDLSGNGAFVVVNDTTPQRASRTANK